jgi:hypothetical protein
VNILQKVPTRTILQRSSATEVQQATQGSPTAIQIVLVIFGPHGCGGAKGRGLPVSRFLGKGFTRDGRPCLIITLEILFDLDGCGENLP